MNHLDLEGGKLKNVRTIIWRKDPVGAGLEFLITQEQSGSFSLPGGCKDLEDRDLHTTLQRELKEELGFGQEDYEIVETGVVREYENLYKNPKSERFAKNTIITLFIISGIVKEPVADNEIAGVAWVSEAKVLDILKSDHSRELFGLGVAFLKEKIL